MPNLGLQHRQSLRNTIVFFDPVLVQSDDLDLSAFLQTFVDQEGLFQFRINPSSVRVSKSKLTQLVLTEGGYERAHFGNGLTTLAYRGTTGYLWTPQGVWNNVTRDVRLAPVLQKFIRFEMFYDRLPGDVAMLSHRGDLFMGTLTSFNYTEDANNPWQILYEFTMEAYTDALGRQRLGEAIKRLSFKAFLGDQLMPQIYLRGLNEALGLGELKDTVAYRVLESLI